MRIELTIVFQLSVVDEVREENRILDFRGRKPFETLKHFLIVNFFMGTVTLIASPLTETFRRYAQLRSLSPFSFAWRL